VNPAAHPDTSQQAAVGAALLLLDRMGLSPADLVAVPRDRPTVPTFAEYIPVVSAAVTSGTRRAYGSYWNRVIEHWGDRRLDEPSPSEIRQLMAYVKVHVVARRNARGGRGAAEHLVAALRCLYRHAQDDGLITEADNPARKVAKPRRLPSTRRAVADTRLAEINHAAATTGNDPALDTLLLRLHTETACRRGGALALRPEDLDPAQCLIFLREKAGTVRWQPVSPTLMTHLTLHGQQRHATPGGQLLRYAKRPAAHHPPLRPPVDPHRHLPALGGHPADQHPLAAAHHPDLGRAQLRLRRRPRLRRTHRHRRRLRRHVDLRPRQPLRSRRRAGRAHRRAPPARHAGRVVISMAVLTAGARRADHDPGPRGPSPERTAGPVPAADRSPAVPRSRKTVRSWPLLVLAAPAAAEVWSGWVGIAQKTGFGLVSPLPGIWPSLHLDTTITLPVGVEAYAAYALRAWLATEHAVSARTRRFAKWSAVFSFALGMAGQVAYHLLAQASAARAPWAITTIVSCLPVLVLGMGTALAHMLRADSAAADTPDSRAGGPADVRPGPARFSADRAGPGRDQAAGQQSVSGPPDRSEMSPRRDRGAAAGARRPVPRAAQPQMDQALLIARRLAAEGKPVSRRALRSGGARGSNEALNVLARQVNAELAGAAVS